MNIIFLSWGGQEGVENILNRGIVKNRDFQVYSFLGDIHTSPDIFWTAT